MSGREAAVAIARRPSAWSALLVVALGVGSVLVGASAAGQPVEDGEEPEARAVAEPKDPNAAVTPLVVIIGVQAVGYVVQGLFRLYRDYRATIRAERIADAEADSKGMLGVKGELAEALKQLAERDAKIADLRKDHQAALAERDATNLHQGNTIAALREQIRAQDARQADLANQVASMAETMAGLMDETKRTREAAEETKAVAEETKAAVLPTADPEAKP